MNESRNGRVETESTTADRQRLFGIYFDHLSMAGAVDQILAWCREAPPACCRYVVTPNVDHVVLFHERKALRAAYRDAALVLVDGMPVVWASRLLGRSLPGRVAGSDLVPALFERACGASSPECAKGTASTDLTPVPGAALKVFLLGAGPGVADEAAMRIRRDWPGVNVVGTESPPLGFENDGGECRRILASVAAAGPDLLLVGLGAPKQEVWTHRHRAEIRAKVVLCVGATIDFLAGAKSRSPLWMRKCGLEWLHRVSTEPRRLARRYARDAWVFPNLVWREWRTKSIGQFHRQDGTRGR